ncbi:MAG: DUF2723 domain-containing protein [candidate division WOR-3 bacterium]
MDSGEFITAAQYLNILHPTGYPLYTLFLRLSAFFPIIDLAKKVNFLSALFSSFSVFFFFLFLLSLQKELTIALSLSFLYAFSDLIWSISNEAEVYSLTALFATLILFLLTNWEKKNIPLLIAFLFGLAFTNHMMIISLFFSFLLFFFQKREKISPLYPLLFLLGLSLYLFLPIRSSLSPLFNWGNPKDLTRFFWHITGKQYRVWMFSASFSEIFQNFKQGISLLLRNTLFFFLPLSLFGIFFAFRQEKRFTPLFFLLALLSFFYAINYSIPDIQPYYLLTFISLLYFLSFTLKGLAKKIKLLSRAYLLLLPLPIILNFSNANKRDYYLALDFARNAFISAPDSSIILTNWWDFYAPSLYLQHIKGERKDLIIIDKELLRRSWYYDYLKKVYPELLKKSERELAEFLPYLHQFEYGNLKDNLGIQEAFIRLIRSFLEKSPKRRHFFLFLPSFDHDLPFILKGKKVIPYGILFEIRDDTVYYPFAYRQLTYRLPKKRLEERERVILDYYHLLAQERQKYLKTLKKEEGIENWLKK